MKTSDPIRTARRRQAYEKKKKKQKKWVLPGQENEYPRKPRTRRKKIIITITHGRGVLIAEDRAPRSFYDVENALWTDEFSPRRNWLFSPDFAGSRDIFVNRFPYGGSVVQVFKSAEDCFFF